MIEGEVRDRLAEGNGILEMELDKVSRGAELVLGAIKGFRRDLALTSSSHEKYIRSDFEGFVAELAVPPMESGESFADLEKFMKFAEEAVDGKIEVYDPMGFLHEERKKMIADLEGTHENLMALSDMSRNYFEIIRNASKEFDTFNGNNTGLKTEDADIKFNRDSLNMSMETARAISERAVRMDIDLTAKINELKANE